MTKRNPFCGSFRSERFLNDLLVLPTVCIVTLLLLLLLLITPSRVESHTHLKLDKTTGLIDPVLDSAFTLQRPFDLVSLLNQIERFYRLEKIKSFIAAASPSSSSSSLASSSSHDKNGDNLDSCIFSISKKYKSHILSHLDLFRISRFVVVVVVQLPLAILLDRRGLCESGPRAQQILVLRDLFASMARARFEPSARDSENQIGQCRCAREALL